MAPVKTIMDKGWSRSEMAQQAAEEPHGDDHVNLGINTLAPVASYTPEDVHTLLQSENGIPGIGAFPHEGEEDTDLINVGRQTVTPVLGVAIFDSATSSGMICGGAAKMAALSVMEVSRYGGLANWMIPRRMVKDMGGATDLVADISQTVVSTDHVSKDDKPKLVKACEPPLTGVKVIRRIISNLGSFDVVDDYLVLRRLVSGMTLADIETNTETTYMVDSKN